MGKLSGIAEKCLWVLTGAAALALFTHFSNPEPEKLVIITQTTAAKESPINPPITLKDHEQITVTTKATESTFPEKDLSPTETTTESQEPKSLININTATLDELMTLPGIGEVKAQSIINYREQYGGFGNIDELLEVSGIGEKTLDKFRNDITV